MDDEPAAARKRGFLRRHLALTSLGVILLVLLGTVGGFLWYLNHELGNIRHFDAGITEIAGPNASTPDVLSSGTFTNPIRLAQVIGTLAGFIQVDDTWSTGDLRTPGVAMRNLSSSNVSFTTVPLGRYDDIASQSVVRLDEAKSARLFELFSRGRMRQYLAANPGSSLPGDTAVR